MTINRVVSRIFGAGLRTAGLAAVAGLLVAFGAAFPGGSGSAYALTLDFETDSSGTPLAPGAFNGGAYSGFGIAITGTTALSLFNSNCGPDFGVSCTGDDPDLATGPTFGTAPQGNVLIIQDPGSGDPGDAGFGGTITFDFASPTTLTEIVLLDNDNGPGIYLEIFQDGVVGSSIITPSIADDNVLQAIAFGALGIDVIQLVVNFPSSGAIASLSVAQVPVPAALPLLLSALAWLGFIARRRRSTAVAAA